MRDFTEFTGTPSATVTGDIDGDGKDDLVVVTTDFDGSSPGGDQLYVFYQEAGGLDTVKFVDTAGSFTDKTWSVAACDIDGDGKKEILVGYASGDLTVFKVGADRTPFLTATLSAIRSIKVICADIDGDGLSDVVTVGKPSVNVQVLIQKNGTLTEEGSFPATDVAVAYGNFGVNRPLVEVGDLDGDGNQDIVFFGRATGSFRVTLNAYFQKTAGMFDPPVQLDFPRDANDAIPANEFVITDLYSNGGRNVVATLGGNAPSAKIAIASYGTNGQSLNSASFTTLDVPSSIRVSDINGDGRNDIVVFHDGWGFGIQYQDTDSSFTSEKLLDVPAGDQALSGQAVAVGNYDAGGKRDVAVVTQSALFVFFQQ